MRIVVTKEDIADGRAFTCTKCPVALAMSRAFGMPIYVGPTSWGAFKDGGPIGRTPELAAEFMTRFDVGLPVQPFEFEVPDAL